jgi:hypothetical protein
MKFSISAKASSRAESRPWRVARCICAVHHLLPGALADYYPMTINPPWIARTHFIGHSRQPAAGPMTSNQVSTATRLASNHLATRTAKSASFFFPPFKAATSHRGLLPLPAQVSLEFSGLRYLGARARRLPRPFVLIRRGIRAEPNSNASKRCSESVRRLRSRTTRKEIAASTFPL